jgi:hypothetical protein
VSLLPSVRVSRFWHRAAPAAGATQRTRRGNGRGVWKKTSVKKRLRAIADRGYYGALQIKACADIGIAPILPKPTTSGAKRKAASTDQTSSTSRRTMSTSVPLASARSIDSQPNKVACRCDATGAAPVRSVR